MLTTWRVAAAHPQVQRRFKHFAWLHDRLVDSYPCICVPPLPVKDFEAKFGTSIDFPSCSPFSAPAAAGSTIA